MHPAFNDSLFMRTLRRQPTPTRPVWLMRQAGRYLPEYRKLRTATGNFLTMVKTPDIACEITLQPIERFSLDAAIIFSDILTIPDALGLGLHFIDGEGPRLTTPLTNEQEINRMPDTIAPLQYVFDACTLTRQALPPHVPLIGFAGTPFTLACYMIDGSGGAFWRTRAMYRQRPDLFHRVLDITRRAVSELLIGQLNAGCQAVMLFDSWGGLLSDSDYENFSLQYIRQIINDIGNKAPVIVFGRQCGLSLPAIANCGCAAAGVDWQTALPTAKRLTGGKVALQGNLDPAVLLTDENTVRQETLKTLHAYGNDAGHIFNLGHGVDKNTPPNHVAALVETVKNYRIPVANA